MTPPQPATDIATQAAAFGMRRHSLSWRLILPLPLTLIVAIAVTWVIIPRMIQQNVLNEAITEGQQFAGRFQTLRGYYTDRVVAKAVSHGLQVTSDHMTNPDAIPLPATMILDLSDLLAQRSTRIRLYSKYPFPTRANRQLDRFQQDALDFLTANPTATFSRIETQGNKHIVRTAVPDIMTVQACVSCHNTIAGSPKTDWKIGDVRGV